MLGLDKKISDYCHHYNDFTLDTSKSLQEISGYSEHPEVTEVLNRIKQKLGNAINIHDLPQKKVLDIGCGPALFLKEYPADFEKTGIDLMPEMIGLAKETIPDGKFYTGDFLKTKIEGKFGIVHSVGLLIYINKSKIETFFQKVHDLLEDDGIFFLSYPHALSKKDLYYPDMNYVQYSPNFIQFKASKNFEVLYHQHVTDDRYVGKFDETTYLHPIDPSWRYYKNSSIIILRKK